MFASVRRYRLQAGSIDDLLHLIDADFAESVQEMDGFLEYQVMECGNGEIVAITTFRDRRCAEASQEMAAAWIRDTLAAQFDLVRLEAFVGEVAISRARDELLEPARYWVGDALDLEAIERELRARHAELQDRLAGLSKPPERAAELGFGKRIGDGTTEAVSRLTDVGVGRNLEVTAERTARALAKLKEGSHGVCDACGGPIAPARLRAAPDSVLCIECARR